jgi:hypothetical protein
MITSDRPQLVGFGAFPALGQWGRINYFMVIGYLLSQFI